MTASGLLSGSFLLGLPRAFFTSQPDVQRQEDIRKSSGTESRQVERIGVPDGTMTSVGCQLASTEPRTRLFMHLATTAHGRQIQLSLCWH